MAQRYWYKIIEIAQSGGAEVSAEDMEMFLNVLVGADWKLKDVMQIDSNKFTSEGNPLAAGHRAFLILEAHSQNKPA